MDNRVIRLPHAHSIKLARHLKCTRHEPAESNYRGPCKFVAQAV